MNEELLITGVGTPESQWHDWLLSQKIPAKFSGDLVSPTVRLVVVAPHPDDEILTCGGLVAAHTAAGGETLVVGVTDGENSHAGASGWNDHQLAKVRCVERIEGLRRLGADIKIIRLGLPDGRVQTHTEQLYQTLMDILLPSDVVVSTWRSDGHPDHDSSGSSTAHACLAVGCRLLEAPVWMWHWGAPNDARVPWHRMVSVPLKSFALKCKRNALAAHTTQLCDRDASTGPVLGIEMLYRAARTKEYFFV